MEDLTKSLIRYVKNNYMDGARQDGFDIALGNYKIISISWDDSPYNITRPAIVNMVSVNGMMEN
jgi:hypothetical protein